MEVDKLIEELKAYDFKRNSISSFSLKTGISQKTIKKYLVQNNIAYNSKGVKHNGIRDSSGRFCITNKEEKQDIRTSIPPTVPSKKNPTDQSFRHRILDGRRTLDITKIRRSPEDQIDFIKKSLGQK